MFLRSEAIAEWCTVQTSTKLHSFVDEHTFPMKKVRRADFKRHIISKKMSNAYYVNQSTWRECVYAILLPLHVHVCDYAILLH